MLGTTLGVFEGAKLVTTPTTTYGANTDNRQPSTDYRFFTGKPNVEGLGNVFLFRNYRSDLGKWQTSDPMGYPDGFNNFAYVNNGVTMALDRFGTDIVAVIPNKEFDDTETFAREYWMQMKEHNEDIGGEKIILIEASDANDAKTKLENYSKVNSIEKLYFSGHGDASTQIVGSKLNATPLYGENLFLDTINVDAFFTNIKFSKDAQVEFWGCSVGQDTRDPNNPIRNLAQRLSQLKHIIVSAPEGATHGELEHGVYNIYLGKMRRFKDGIEE